MRQDQNCQDDREEESSAHEHHRTTAVLDDEDRIVPRKPLSERPVGEFRVIMLVDDKTDAPPRSGGRSLLALAAAAEPMGALTNEAIDALIHGS